MAMNLIKRPEGGEERKWGRKIRESEEEQARRKGEGVNFSDVFFLAGNVGLRRQAMTTSMQFFLVEGRSANRFCVRPRLPVLPECPQADISRKSCFSAKTTHVRGREDAKGHKKGGRERERQSGFRRLLAQKKRLAGRREVIFCRLSPADCLPSTPKWESNE